MEDKLQLRTHYSCIKTEADARLPVPLSTTRIVEFAPYQTRASIRYLSRTSTSLTYILEGLSQPANSYEKFDMLVRQSTNGAQAYYNTWTSRNTGRSTEHTATGLKPSTQYDVVCEALTNKWWPVGSANNWTDKAPDSTAPSCSCGTNLTGWTKNTTFTAYVDASDSGSGVKKVWLALCNKSGTGMIQEKIWGNDNGGVINNGRYTHTFNTPGNGEYTIKATVKDVANNTKTDTTNSFHLGLDNKPPVIQTNPNGCWIQQNGAGITGYMRGTDGESGTLGCYYYISRPNSDTLGDPIFKEGAVTECTFTVDGAGNAFKVGATYKVSMGLSDNVGNFAPWQWKSIVYKTPKPGNWSWSGVARAAFQGQGQTTKLTHSEWNNFIDRLIAFSKWYDPGSENKVYYGLTLAQAKASAQGATLTASMFNRARYAVGSIVSTGIEDKKSRESIVKGADFLTLETCINKAPDKPRLQLEEECQINPLNRLESEVMYRELFKEIETVEMKKLLERFSNRDIFYVDKE